MDSVTQFALGAALGELVLGRKIGWRAALWGGVCGTLPDLDVFVPLGDAVSDFTYHRSVSHSVFVLALAAPLIAELLTRMNSRRAEYRGRWYAMVFAVLLTHPVLDCFTVYGTQILWPLDKTPVAWSTLFIIDPAYTLPLIIGLLCALIMARSRPTGHLINTLGLILSTAYVGWSVVAKQQADGAARAALARAGMPEARFMTIAGPFTTLIWRIVAVDDKNYYNGYYSLLDPEDAPLPLVAHSRRMELARGIGSEWAVQRLQWFTDGFYTLKLSGGDVQMADLRMGFEPNYVFTFKVGEISNPHTVPVDTTPAGAGRPGHFATAMGVEQDLDAGRYAAALGSVDIHGCGVGAAHLASGKARKAP